MICYINPLRGVFMLLWSYIRIPPAVRRQYGGMILYYLQLIDFSKYVFNSQINSDISVVTILPPYCRRTAAGLPPYCRRTAAVLPPYCRRTAGGILMYDRYYHIPTLHLMQYNGRKLGSVLQGGGGGGGGYIYPYRRLT